MKVNENSVDDVLMGKSLSSMLILIVIGDMLNVQTKMLLFVWGISAVL